MCKSNFTPYEQVVYDDYILPYLRGSLGVSELPYIKPFIVRSIHAKMNTTHQITLDIEHLIEYMESI